MLVPAARPGQPAMADKPGLTVGAALRSRAFIVLALTFFACCATHSGPIFHTISYAVTGIAPMTAVSIYGIEGLAGLGGRILLGTLADRHGVRPVLVAGAGRRRYAPPAGAASSIVAVVFGLAYGGVMPLYAVLAREYFGPRIMGTVFGAAAMISSLGMALGPPLGGWVFDQRRYHVQYPTWLEGDPTPPPGPGSCQPSRQRMALLFAVAPAPRRTGIHHRRRAAIQVFQPPPESPLALPVSGILLGRHCLPLVDHRLPAGGRVQQIRPQAFRFTNC